MTAETPSLRDLLFAVGLYERVPLAENDDLRRLQHGNARVDAYCPGCREDSIFEQQSAPEGFNPAIHGGLPTSATEWLQRRSTASRRSGEYTVRLTCTRAGHPMVLHFIADESGITKVGQQPSMADISLGDMRRYRRVLDEIDAKELARGIGRHAHGVGVGAFVYLRRILERMVRRVEAAKGTPPLGGRFIDRIKALGDELPAFLSENPVLYGVLSKGVHEWSENECKAVFPAVRDAIEQVLSDQLAAVEEAERRKRIAKELNNLNSRLGARAADDAPDGAEADDHGS